MWEFDERVRALEAGKAEVATTLVVRGLGDIDADEAST